MSTQRNLATIAVIVVSLLMFAAASYAGEASSIVGRVIDTAGGLPVAGASLDLTCEGAPTKHTTSRADGSYEFAGVQPGVCVVWIFARGYQAARSADINVQAGIHRLAFQAAVTRVSAVESAHTLGRVTVVSNATLQTTMTIHEHIDASSIQNENYMRAGDALISLPGVTTQTGSSLGDDLAISIRGFDSSETATLLDGHRIGPLGAFGGGFDYQVSPFFGLRGIDTVFGSGATGIYGASTISGAVDFQTINPTPERHALFEQGVGNDGKALTGIQATGTINKLGYAFSHAVEGTSGNFAPGTVTQSGLLGSDIRSATIQSVTYTVTGDYNLRNDLAKFTYALSPKTSLLATLYSASSWDDKSGNGDNDYLSYEQNLYNTVSALQQNGGQSSVTLPNGNTATCNNNTQAVLDDSSQGFSCLAPQQFAQLTSGPAGGGVGPWQAIRSHDYHARLTTGIGAGQINIDGFIDHYGLDYNRAVATGSFHTDVYRTTGLFIDDEFASPLHVYAFGYYAQKQTHTGDTYPFFDQFGNGPFNFIAANQSFDQNDSNVFVRDEYTPSQQWSASANLWLDHSISTNRTNFDPRVTLTYHPGSANVVRFTTGKSNSNPDPSLLFAFPSYNTTPTNINPICGQLNSIGGVSNPGLVPETANDKELALGHRFAVNDVVQLDLYDATEHNALFAGNLPLTALGQTQVPPALIQAYLTRINNYCHTNYDSSILAVSTTYNAATARYRGIDLTSDLQIGRNFRLNAEYGVQSATYTGIPDAILSQNLFIIPGSQLSGIPLDKANIGVEFSNVAGFDAQLNSHFIGDNNTYNRPAFWFFNGSVSKKTGNTVLALAVNNVFNNAAQSYGYFGLGVNKPENQFGSDVNSFQEGIERFGLPPRQLFFTVTYQM